MAENCNHDCSSCGEACAERDPRSFLAEPNKGSNIKKVIGIVSGKGGVGKSMVTSLLAVGALCGGKRAGILDADITGPSIPRIFGIEGTHILGNENGLVPAATSTGISVMSINLLLPNSDDPVIWRGPIIAGTVKQFWTEVSWGDLDCLFVDMPPGTGDVPLTVFQSLPVDGIIVVTSPQDLVSMIVGKAAKMASAMNIPILGLVENMSWIECPDCGRKIMLFGESGAASVAEKYGIARTTSLPVLPKLASLCDAGRIEDVEPETAGIVYDLIRDVI